ncbi:MAG: phenylalanine--tRNA ligase subunit alpha [Patescibacteria group bacterium]
MHIIEQLHALEQSATEAFSSAQTLGDLQLLEIRFLGRKGELTTILRGLAEVSAEERPKAGSAGNETKIALEAAAKEAHFRLEQGAVSEKLSAEWVDMTEPGTQPPVGHRHIMSQAVEEITELFERVGFSRVRYPEVEWDYHVFESLNMPKDHPARDDWETFFMDAEPSAKWGRMLLTTQATSGTSRILANNKPPIRAFSIGKTYRRQIDVTHVPMFHQIDIAYVDEGVSVAHLRGMIEYFAKSFYGPDRKTRLRPYHFRFTEPSFEIDVSCGVCHGTGKLAQGEKCRTCKQGWLELGGSGMLHPNVLKAAGIDPKKYSGLAFGWGVERTYMMKEGLKLDDIRGLYKNDLRFLEQF